MNERSKPETFLDLSARRARAEILHDLVITTRGGVKRGKHCRIMGLGWRGYMRYLEQGLEIGFIEKGMTERGDPGWRRKPEPIYGSTEKGRAWAKIFWDASKPLYGLDGGR